MGARLINSGQSAIKRQISHVLFYDLFYLFLINLSVKNFNLRLKSTVHVKSEQNHPKQPGLFRCPVSVFYEHKKHRQSVCSVGGQS